MRLHFVDCGMSSMCLTLATSLKIKLVLSLAFIVIYNMFNLWQCTQGLSNMVKITAEKRVKKFNLGSNLTSNQIYIQVLRMHECCFVVYLNLPSCLPIFLKKNYSLRQNILKTFKVFERGHSHRSQLVFIWILFELGLD